MELPKKTMETLQALYKDEGFEIGGYITPDNAVIVCENDSPNPVENFAFKMEDLEKINDEENVVALFHTHPNGTGVMSKQDFKAFLNYPQFFHLIVGKSEVLCYKITERETAIIEDIVINEGQISRNS